MTSSAGARRPLRRREGRLLAELLCELRADWPLPEVEAALRSANGPYTDGAVLAQQALAVAAGSRAATVPDQIGRAEVYYPRRADGSSTSPAPFGTRCEHGSTCPCVECGDARVLSGRSMSEHAEAARLAVRVARDELDRKRAARRRELSGDTGSGRRCGEV